MPTPTQSLQIIMTATRPAELANNKTLAILDAAQAGGYGVRPTRSSFALLLCHARRVMALKVNNAVW
jgi:hypothetical protein